MLDSVESAASALRVIRWGVVGGAALTFCLTLALTMVGNRLDELRSKLGVVRHLTQEQKKFLVATLSNFRGHQVVIIPEKDKEVTEYAGDFIDVFNRAGWSVSSGTTAFILDRGITIMCPDLHNKDVTAFKKALDHLNITSTVRSGGVPDMINLFIGFEPHSN